MVWIVFIFFIMRTMANNYGLGSRDMAKAGVFACNAAARTGAMSYSTAATVGERWQKFAEFARSQGVKKLESVSRELVMAYGKELAKSDLSESYSQNLVSAVNSVMSLATKGTWHAVSPTKECEIEKRSAIRVSTPDGLDRAQFKQVLQKMEGSGLGRQAVIADLAKNLGLRSKEASLFNANQALQQAESSGKVRITAGTKGGRPRALAISATGLQSLRHAAALQGNNRNLIPTGQSWKQWRGGGLRAGREALKGNGIRGLHELRSAYACERYAQITGSPAPVISGKVGDRKLDRIARETIAKELGHGRIDVVAEYVGGRK